MNTRKTDLKKLRLPTTGNSDSRDGRRKATSTISNFFTSEKSPINVLNEVVSVPYPPPIEGTLNSEDNLPKRPTRTKLSTFLPKEKRIKLVVENPISDFLIKINSDDFEKQGKSIKKAPKAKSRPKKQRKIKTIFLKNEELFTAVTAQHCLVDNISPDEMQMVLALSRSEADAGGVLAINDDDEETSKADKTGIRGKLKKFGFRVAETEDYNITAFMPTKTNTKWGNKFTALTLRNPKKQLERVHQKVEELLSTQFMSCDSMDVDEKWNYSIKSEVLLPLVASDNVIIRPDRSPRVDLFDFYVVSLFEPSTTKAGHLLKDVRRIAGRDRTPDKTRSFPKVEIIIDPQLQNPVMKKSGCDEISSLGGLSLSCTNTAEKLHHVSPVPATSYARDITIDTFSKNLANPCLNSTANDASLNVTNFHLNDNGSNCDEENVCVYDKSSSRISTKTNSFPNCNHEDVPTQTNNSKSPISISSNDLENDFYSNGIALNNISNDRTERRTPSMSIITTTCSMSGGSCIQSRLPLSSIRSTSPDIFADSDVEMEAESCSKIEGLNGNRCSSSGHPITTYERFSSDDVKTSSETKSEPNKVNHNSITAVFDLTQCGSDTRSLPSETLPPSLPLKSYQDHSQTDGYSLSVGFKDEKPSTSFVNFTPIESKRTCFSFGSNASEKFHKSRSFNQSKTEDSIDLTQNSDEENSYILLTDDEINYSIWKTANNSQHVQKEEEEHLMSQNVTIDHLLNDSKVGHEFSFVDLVADTPLLASEFHKTQSNTSLDISDLELSKRSDFGILEEQSPFKTPTKIPKKSQREMPTSSKCRRTLSASFIASPMESTAPLKRFSSTQKFSEFTKTYSNSSSELDDIDQLIYGSPSKKPCKKPAGLEQLLTGTISEQNESPQQAVHESPNEFEFNGRTYLVRTGNVAEKPNYETMDESTLLDQLYRYGIRKLNPKQAVRILEYVYNQTHPCLIDESNNPSFSDNDKLINAKQERKPSAHKFDFKDCWGHILVSDIDVSLEIENDKYITTTNTSKKVSTAPLPFHVAWNNLVRSNKLLHEAILHYDPIDLQEIYLFFKSIGYRYDPKDMKCFFDSRSIIFRYDLNKHDANGGAVRHVRKKQLKFKQRSSKSQSS